MSESNPLPYLISSKGITVSLPTGEAKTVLKSNTKQFEDAVLAIREERWDDVVRIVNPAKAVETFSDGKFQLIDGVVRIDGEAVPEALNRQIVEFIEAKLPYQPLVNFWNNLKNNPSYRAVQQLFSFLLVNDHPITEDGCFLAYRRVTSDFKDFYTGTMDNSIGAVVQMPRREVDENPEQTCSNGIHASNWEYAAYHYHGGEGVLVMVKINPADVVAIPVDYNQAKMRVCRLEVLQVVECELEKRPLYSSDGTDFDDEDEEECNGCCDSCCDCDDDDEDEDDDVQEERDMRCTCETCVALDEEEDDEDEDVCMCGDKNCPYSTKKDNDDEDDLW